MRIADKMQFNQVNGNIQKNRSEMSDLQNEASTQKRINKPSDDPLASARVLGARTEERGNEQFTKNIAQAKSFLEFSEQSLGELSDALVRAKELAVAQASDAGASAHTRRIAGIEVQQLFKQAIQVGNRKLGDRYIFGGYKTQSQPFTPEGEYHGDDGEIRIMSHKDAFVSMNMPGSKAFLGKDLGGDGIQRPATLSPHNVDELHDMRDQEQAVEEQKAERDQNMIMTRGPASIARAEHLDEKDPATGSLGVNVFSVLKGLEIALKTNDKEGVQTSMDLVDQALDQIVVARAEIGSRVSTLNANTDSLHKAIVDNKTLASQLEDADAFQVVSDINKNESTLKATLETSGKLIQPRLLDFLK